jgi:hypothetical protein
MTTFEKLDILSKKYGVRVWYGSPIGCSWCMCFIAEGIGTLGNPQIKIRGEGNTSEEAIEELWHDHMFESLTPEEKQQQIEKNKQGFLEK